MLTWIYMYCAFLLTLVLYSLIADLAFNSDQQFCPVLQLPKLSQILIDHFDLDFENGSCPLNHVPTFMHYLYSCQEAQTGSLESSVDKSTTPVLDTTVNRCGNSNNFCKF